MNNTLKGNYVVNMNNTNPFGFEINFKSDCSYCTGESELYLAVVKFKDITLLKDDDNMYSFIKTLNESFSKYSENIKPTYIPEYAEIINSDGEFIDAYYPCKFASKEDSERYLTCDNEIGKVLLCFELEGNTINLKFNSLEYTNDTKYTDENSDRYYLLNFWDNKVFPIFKEMYDSYFEE